MPHTAKQAQFQLTDGQMTHIKSSDEYNQTRSAAYVAVSLLAVAKPLLFVILLQHFPRPDLAAPQMEKDTVNGLTSPCQNRMA